MIFGGKTEIRTLDRGKPYDGLVDRCFKPLSHLSVKATVFIINNNSTFLYNLSRNKFIENVSASRIRTSQSLINSQVPSPSWVMRNWIFERVVRFEPTASAWKAEILPLYDTRFNCTEERESNPLFPRPNARCSWPHLNYNCVRV